MRAMCVAPPRSVQAPIAAQMPSTSCRGASPLLQPLRQPRRVRPAAQRLVLTRADGSDGEPRTKVEFGYSRKDVILIGAGLIGLGYALYYGLQYAGLDAGVAGNWVQLIIFLGICVGWVGSYLIRVATKQMTYARQLDDYEEAVMRKRLEEMPEAELEAVLEDVERSNAEREEARRQQREQQQ